MDTYTKPGFDSILSMKDKLTVTEDDIIRGCKRGDRKVQQYVFENYKEHLMGVIRRYVYDVPTAEDVLINTFVKVFTKIETFSKKGGFVAWMRRIAIREALMLYRKEKRMQYVDPVEIPESQSKPDILEKMERDEIYACLGALPEGYRQVLNLYAIDGYKHREIAELLNISIHTSKSQLRMARKRFQEILDKQYNDGKEA